MSHIERLLARAVLEFSSIREAISTPQNRRMHALRRVWMRESVTIRRGSAYETELETFPSRNISGSFKSYLGFYTRGKWSTTSDSNGNLNGFEPFLSASWSSGRCKPQKECESSHTSHMLFRGFVFFLPHISLRLQNTKGQLSLVALVEFESTLNGFSYYSMLPWPHFCVVVWTLSLPYHTTQVAGVKSLRTLKIMRLARRSVPAFAVQPASTLRVSSQALSTIFIVVYHILIEGTSKSGSSAYWDTGPYFNNLVLSIKNCTKYTTPSISCQYLFQNFLKIFLTKQNSLATTQPSGNLRILATNPNL